MARIFGTVLILAGCAGFLYKGRRGKKPDSGWRGNGYACLCAGDMHWNRNTCGCTIFCLFMKRQMHPCRHFWMRSVYVCATIRIQAGRKSGRIVCRSTKVNCRSGRRAGKSLRLPAGAFYGESSAENLRCNEICRKRMEKFLAESRLEFFKKQRVYLPVGMLTGVVMIILLV